MKYIKTEDAVGHVLCHDITKIIPGSFKGTGFKKGHVVRSEDSAGTSETWKRTSIYLGEQEGMLHEDEAAYILAGVCLNDGMAITGEPREGKNRNQGSSRRPAQSRRPASDGSQLFRRDDDSYTPWEFSR